MWYILENATDTYLEVGHSRKFSLSLEFPHQYDT